MMAFAAGLFGALLGLALLCRASPPERLTSAVDRLLAFFGVAAPEPALAAGDFFGISGAGGFVVLLLAERSGWPLDGVLLVDLALSALGVGLALTWFIARVTTESQDLWAEAGDAPRELFTEADPREPESSSSEPG